MKTLNGLPVYKMTINEKDEVTGVEYISLVDCPAIEVNWVAMSTKTLKLYAASEDKRMLYGPAMIPDLPIYRVDENMGEYYVSFDADEIEKIFRKFNKEQRTLGINYMHQDNSQVKSAVITEQWTIRDKENDYSNTLGFNLPVGTKMVGVYIEDTEFWNKEIKSGNVRGFSIEGFLNLQMAKITINKNTNTNMTKVKMNAEIKTADGVVLYTTADGFVEKAEVFVVDADGNQTPATDGDIVLENGATITVKDGIITAVVEPAAASEDKPKDTPEETTKMAITPEDIQAVADALKIGDMIATINDLSERVAKLEGSNEEMKKANEELTKANTEMAAKFSKLPGSTTSATDKTDVASMINTKLSITDKVERLSAFKQNKK